MKILVAADARWVRELVLSAFVGPGQEVVEVTRGQDVRAAVTEHEPDLVILDMQIGNMGGIAVAIDLRLEESAGRVPETLDPPPARPRGRPVPRPACRRRRDAGQAGRRRDAAPGREGTGRNGREGGFDLDSPSSGRSAVWLARSVRDAEAAGSNPAVPTGGDHVQWACASTGTRADRRRRRDALLPRRGPMLPLIFLAIALVAAGAIIVVLVRVRRASAASFEQSLHDEPVLPQHVRRQGADEGAPHFVDDTEAYDALRPSLRWQAPSAEGTALAPTDDPAWGEKKAASGPAEPSRGRRQQPAPAPAPAPCARACPAPARPRRRCPAASAAS